MSANQGTTFGAFFKNKRQQLGLTLREFCLKNSIDPGNVSRLERDVMAPPSHEHLEHYANCLELERNSEDWIAFFDLAAAAKGRIPNDLMQDENLVAKLPALFRTLRGRKLDRRVLDQIIKKVRGG